MKRNVLVIKQLDRQFEDLMVRMLARPKEGWIRTIRKALGMTGKQFANRLGVNRSRVIRIEEDESRDAVTLRTLKNVAEVLNCELVYALVPIKSLHSTLRNQARKIAKQRMERVTRTMQLENQGIESKHQEELEQELIESLLNGPLKYLWEE